MAFRGRNLVDVFYLSATHGPDDVICQRLENRETASLLLHLVWYTGLLIVDIIVVFAPHLLVADAKQNILFGPTVFVSVLCIIPFILLLFLNTAGEEGTEFHGESRWLFATMSAQIFDAIDMIDNVLNGYGNGTPIGLGVGMIILAFGCLLLAA